MFAGGKNRARDRRAAIPAGMAREKAALPFEVFPHSFGCILKLLQAPAVVAQASCLHPKTCMAKCRQDACATMWPLPIPYNTLKMHPIPSPDILSACSFHRLRGRLPRERSTVDMLSCSHRTFSARLAAWAALGALLALASCSHIEPQRVHGDEALVGDRAWNLAHPWYGPQWNGWAKTAYWVGPGH